MKLLGAIVLVLGLVIGILPQFTDCQSQGRMITLENGKTLSMKCHWTARSEIAMAAPLVAMGLVTTVVRRKDTRMILGFLGLILGAFVISLPTWLVGVCASPDMVCNAVMKPALILSGIVVSAASLGVMGIAWTAKE